MTSIEKTLEGAIEEFLALRRGGKQLDPSAFAARYPEHAPALLDALESAVLLEHARFERDDDVPTRLGRFRVVRELGRGAMGVVLEAVEEPLQRSVALKLLSRHLVTSASARARFEREAALAARLDDPGLCTVYDAGVTDGRWWIAMRLIEGESLARRIVAAKDRGERCVDVPNSRALEPTLAIAACFARAARALAAAHAQGVVHRDVKPSNLMVTTGGQPVWVDFGLAVGLDSETASLTRTGETTGTPAYLAPELISGELERPDDACDLYALGVTLHECLTLDRPFHGPTRDALYRAILAGTADDVRRSNPAVSRDLAVVVSTAIAHDRARRYSDAALFAADLEAVVARRPIAARPLGALGRALSWARREPRQATLIAALIAAALALAVTGGWLIASRDDVAAGRSAQHTQAVDDALVEGFDELGSGRHARAEAAFERALELDPANVEAAAGRIFALLRMVKHDDAVAALRDAPRSPAFERLRAMAAGVPPTPGDRGWWKAASSFELFVEGERLRAEGERHPVSERPAWMRAACEHLDEAVVRSPRARAYYHHLRAFAASDAADENKTRSAVDALVSLWPDSPRALYAAGASLVHVDPREARELLQRATTLDPTQAPWLQSLGTAQLILGELEEAKATFERARRLDPLDVHVLNGLGVAEINAGCLDEARAALWEAVAIDPNYIEAWGNLAQIGSIEDDPEATAAAARRVLELDPGQVEYRTFCVWALVVRGDFDGGRKELEIALAQEPTNAVNWLRHGKLLLMVGEPRDAAESLARARSLDPTLAELPDLDAEASAQLAAGR